MVFCAVRSCFVGHIFTLVFRVTISEGNDARGVWLLVSSAQSCHGGDFRGSRNAQGCDVVSRDCACM